MTKLMLLCSLLITVQSGNLNSHEVVDTTRSTKEFDVFGNSPEDYTRKITDRIEYDKYDIPTFGLRFTHFDTHYKNIKQITKFAIEYLNIRMVDLPNSHEDAVLDAIHEVPNIKREDLYLIYKQNYTMFGTDDTKTEIDNLFKRTGLDYIDLYIIHFVDSKGFYLQTWKTMISQMRTGRLRSIGLGNVNFMHVNYLYQQTGVYPAVIQLEINPFFQQLESLQHFQKLDIIIQAYGTIANAEHLDDVSLNEIGLKYEKTVPQVMQRWCLQQNFSCLTRSRRINRIAENADVYDFDLSDEDIMNISRLETGIASSFDPNNIEHLKSVDEIIGETLEKRGNPLEQEFAPYELLDVMANQSKTNIHEKMKKIEEKYKETMKIKQQEFLKLEKELKEIKEKQAKAKQTEQQQTTFEPTLLEKQKDDSTDFEIDNTANNNIIQDTLEVFDEEDSYNPAMKTSAVFSLKPLSNIPEDDNKEETNHNNNVKMSTEKKPFSLEPPKHNIVKTDENEENIPDEKNNETATKKEEDEEEISTQYYFSTDINLEPSYKHEDSFEKENVPDEMNQVSVDNSQEEYDEHNDDYDDDDGEEYFDEELDNIQGQSMKITESEIFSVPMNKVGEACKKLSKDAIAKQLKEAYGENYGMDL